MQQCQRIDYREWCRLQGQNYELRQELEDLRSKYQNIKKQQQIWAQINRYNISSCEQYEKSQNKQLQQLKEQFVTLVKQKQQQQKTIRQQEQKIEDYKYRLMEMRQMKEEKERIHQKQIQFFFREKDGGDGGKFNSSRVKEIESRWREATRRVEELEEMLAEEREANARNVEKLEKCSSIAKEMEEYYNNELESRQSIITQLQRQLSSHKNCHPYPLQSLPHPNDLPSPQTKLPSNLQTSEDYSSLKCSSIVSQYHQFHNQDNSGQQKYEKMMDEMRMGFGKEIAMYQEKVRYLVLKVQALEAEKKYLIRNGVGGQGDQMLGIIDTMQSIGNFSQINPTKLSKLTSHQQSLNTLNQSNTSAQNDSFTQFTPKSEISSSLIRQNSRQTKNITLRPKLTSIKTPNKSVQKLINVGGGRSSCSYQRIPLGERNEG